MTCICGLLFGKLREPQFVLMTLERSSLCFKAERQQRIGFDCQQPVPIDQVQLQFDFVLLLQEKR